jgi:subtilisin family serine protease
MRLDQLPGNYRGQGVKIAIVDSGAATSHDNLHGIRAGFDVINKKTNPDSWDQDTLGHGTHCAGVIAAADIASGIRGFAPDAEVHACKLFPGGQVSQLIDALEYCIDKQIDVVNLSLGGAEVSEALEQQIIRAKRAGVACIVAAGNSGGAVQYPASSPNVLAVAAIGKLDEFPADSYHAQTLDSNVDAYGYFTAKFSCFGPQVGVCAPGVAITSCVPPNNFAAWDGTSMATPHVTGLAALCLAHHPDFQTQQYKARGAERVERLFQVIRASAHKVSLGDQSRVGFGLPDALLAVGLQPAGARAPIQPQQLVSPMMGSLISPMAAPASMYDPFTLGAMQYYRPPMGYAPIAW